MNDLSGSSFFPTETGRVDNTELRSPRARASQRITKTFITIQCKRNFSNKLNLLIQNSIAAAVAEWYGYRTVACFVTDYNLLPFQMAAVAKCSWSRTSDRRCRVTDSKPTAVEEPASREAAAR
ncbi:hypothetical protein TNCV_1937311 [Trichonephila clavipes]|nr:hypothetical protein TNCV_1937311 [Trichonephila clavipes]